MLTPLGSPFPSPSPSRRNSVNAANQVQREIPCPAGLKQRYLDRLTNDSAVAPHYQKLHQELTKWIQFSAEVAKKNIADFSDAEFRDLLERFHEILNEDDPDLKTCLDAAGFKTVSRYSLYSNERARGKICALLEWSENKVRKDAERMPHIDVARPDGAGILESHICHQVANNYMTAALLTVAHIFEFDDLKGYFPDEDLVAPDSQTDLEKALSDENTFKANAAHIGLPSPNFYRYDQFENYKKCIVNLLSKGSPLIALFLNAQGNEDACVIVGCQGENVTVAHHEKLHQYNLETLFHDSQRLEKEFANRLVGFYQEPELQNEPVPDELSW